MLEPLLFRELETAVASFSSEFRSLLAFVETTIDDAMFIEAKKQRIEFIDSEHHTLRDHGLLLRQRTLLSKKKAAVELTLKCRSPDFCLPVAFRDTAERNGTGKVKLEEDIAPPYVSRFSTSVSIIAKKSILDTSGYVSFDRIIDHFPFLRELELNEQPLVRVNGLQMLESVLDGPGFHVQGMMARMALILWRHPESERIASVEFSFRVPFGESLFQRDIANKLFCIFARFQNSDWVSAKQQTKTAYIYDS